MKPATAISMRYSFSRGPLDVVGRIAGGRLGAGGVQQSRQTVESDHGTIQGGQVDGAHSASFLQTGCVVCRPQRSIRHRHCSEGPEIQRLRADLESPRRGSRPQESSRLCFAPSSGLQAPPSPQNRRRTHGASQILIASASWRLASLPPSPTPRPPPPRARAFGPPVAGLCFFSRDGALGTPRLGRPANARLQAARHADRTANSDPQQQAIVDRKQRASTPLHGEPSSPAPDRSPRSTARADLPADCSRLRQRARCRLTRDRALEQILNTLNPIVGPLASAITARSSSIALPPTATIRRWT